MIGDKRRVQFLAMSRRRSSSRRGQPPAKRPNRVSRHPGGGRLRIIGGMYRRRQLPVLDAPGLRPTPDRVRETLFNWLATTIPGACVLDLFAGTGALGFEALSRGARQATFVERHTAAARQIETNLTTLGAQGHVVNVAVERFLCHEASSRFDLVLLDPPFRQTMAEHSCALLEAQGWLNASAWIYLETERELSPVVPSTWRLHRETRAGDGIGRLFQRRASLTSDAC